MAQNLCFITLAKSVNDDDIDTTSMLTANIDEEIPKEVLATHVSSQDMESHRIWNLSSGFVRKVECKMH